MMVMAMATSQECYKLMRVCWTCHHCTMGCSAPAFQPKKIVYGFRLINNVALQNIVANVTVPKTTYIYMYATESFASCIRLCGNLQTIQ